MLYYAVLCYAIRRTHSAPAGAPSYGARPPRLRLGAEDPEHRDGRCSSSLVCFSDGDDYARVGGGVVMIVMVIELAIVIVEVIVDM